MARARDNRLARVAVSAARTDSPTNLDHLALKAWASVAGVVREGLKEAGIDPAGVEALDLLPNCDADPLLEGGEPGEEFVTCGSDGLAATFAEEIGKIARTFQYGREPDFANASLAELFARCLSRKEQISGKGSA